MNKVSVIIATYNRFDFLLNCISSIKNQTYKNIEIIVINDFSTEKQYYEYDWNKNNIKIVHLEKNSREILGYPSAGFVRNKGLKIATGKYIGFCDDDDIWFPEKIQLQINAMQKTSCKMSCTDGLIGNGVYDPLKKYKKYNSEYYYKDLQNIYKNSKFLENDFPDIWNLEFLKIHNCVICSSVLIEKSILDMINGMKALKNGFEDYDCWLRCLYYTNIVYVKDICFYYDANHGNGQNY